MTANSKSPRPRGVYALRTGPVPSTGAHRGKRKILGKLCRFQIKSFQIKALQDPAHDRTGLCGNT